MEKEGKTVEKPQKSTIIWDAQKKMPKKGVFIVLIIVTISIFIFGIVDSISNTHEIKVVIDYDGGEYWGEINIDDTSYSVNDGGSGIHTYKVQEGATVEVYIYGPSSQNNDLLMVSIFDNGELVEQGSTSRPYSEIHLEYRIKRH